MCPYVNSHGVAFQFSGRPYFTQNEQMYSRLVLADNFSVNSIFMAAGFTVLARVILLANET